MPSPPRLAPVFSGAVAWLRQTWTPKRGRPRTVTGVWKDLQSLTGSRKVESLQKGDRCEHKTRWGAGCWSDVCGLWGGAAGSVSRCWL